jgi:ATP-binding cassette subfamily C (CFTR/MRP) protein 1
MVAAFRGAIVALIYDKSLEYPSIEGDLPAVTLMSTDVDQTMLALRLGCDIWACVLETSIGIWLVWRQLGPIALAPILLVSICSVTNIYVGRLQGKAQGVWAQAVQRRVGFTARTLGSMKSVKLAGLSDTSAKLMQSERVRELAKGKDLRFKMALSNLVCKSYRSFLAENDI